MAQEKGKKPPRRQVPKYLYLDRAKFVEMAFEVETKFVKLLKDHQVRDLSVFIGYEHEPSIVLGTTRKKVQTTTQWNPLVFALVLGKNELYSAIVKHV